MFFLTWPFSGVRQGFVLICGSYILCSLLKKRIGLFSFLALVFLLSSIHISGVALLFFAFIGFYKLPRHIFLVTLFFFLCVSPIIHPLLFELIEGTVFGHRALFYEKQNFTIDFKYMARMFLFLAALSSYYFLFSKLEVFDISVFQIFFFSFIVYSSLKPIEIVAAQISIYGFYFITLIISNGIGNIVSRDIRRIVLVAVILFSSLWSYKDYQFMIESSLNNSSLLKKTAAVFEHDFSLR